MSKIKNEGDIIIIEPPEYIPVMNYINGDTAYVLIIEEVDVSMAKNIVNFINEVKFYPDIEKIYVSINSPGGSVFDGFSIYSALKQSGKETTTCVDGYACSMGSIIFCAGDIRIAVPHSLLMVHNPTGGEDNALIPIKDSLIAVYLQVMPNTTYEELSLLMDEEKWLNYDEMVALGVLSSEIYNLEDSVMNNIDLSMSVKELHGIFNKVLKNKYSNMSKIKNEAEEPEKKDPETEDTAKAETGEVSMDDINAKLDSILAKLEELMSKEKEEDPEPKPDEKAETEEDPEKKEEEAKALLIKENGYNEALQSLPLNVLKDLVAKTTTARKVNAKAIEINITATSDVSITNSSKDWDKHSKDEQKLLVAKFNEMNQAQRIDFSNKNPKLYSKVFLNSNNKN